MLFNMLQKKLTQLDNSYLPTMSYGAFKIVNGEFGLDKFIKFNETVGIVVPA